MGSPKTQRRRTLFRLYAANFEMFVPEHAGCFACPICGALHGEAAVEQPSLAVDLAHVYPSACGGDLMTLTCKRCNSRMGAKYDAHVARDRKLIDALGGSGRQSLDVRISFEGGSLGAEVCRRGDHFDFKVIGEQTHPAFRDSPAPGMIGDGQVKFTMEFLPPDSMRHSVATLHSAYLASFRYFGYEYLFASDTQWARDLFLRDDPPDQLPHLSMDPDGEVEIPPQLMLTPAVAQVAGEAVLAVPLPVTPNPKKPRFVFLPGFGEPAAEAYRRLQATGVGRNQQFHFVGDLMDPAERLAKSGFRQFGQRWWQHWSGKLQ